MTRRQGNPIIRPDSRALPPLIIGYGPRWAIVWLSSTQGANGDWYHAYSIRPGRVVTVTVRPGVDMLPAHDPAYARFLEPIAAGYPASA